MYRQCLKPQNIFAFICLVLGLFFVFFNPPFQTPDEAQHFFKMWGFTQGTFNFKVLNGYSGDILPDSVIKISKFDRLCRHPELKTSAGEIFSALKIKLEKDKTAFYVFTPTSYTPVSYFPVFLILWAMKLINVPPLIMLYIMRLCSLFLYTGLCYQAIKIIPFKKWLFVLLTLLPMAVYEGSSATADPLTTGTGFLLVAYTLYLAYSDSVKNIGKKELCVFGFLITLLLLCKYAYLPFLLLYFVLPKKKFSSAGYDKKFMIAFILNRFHWFMDFVFKTVHAYWMSYYYAFIGLLGCNDAPLPLFALNFYSVMLFGSALIKTNNEEKTVCLKDKIIFVFIFLLTGLIILASVFILFQCYPLFCGVQGRYFIPVMPLFFLLFDNKRIVWNKFPILLILCILILIPFSVTTILNRFYL